MKITYKEFIYKNHLHDSIKSYKKFLEKHDTFFENFTDEGKQQYAMSNFPMRFTYFGGYGWKEV